MRIILTIILMTISLESFASNCYVVDESKVEFRTYAPKGVFYETCPNDLDNKPITTIKDMSYKKTKSTICVSKVDCEDKSKDLCVDVDNEKRRLIISSKYDEVYCVHPVFSKTKRKNRLQKIKDTLEKVNLRDLSIKDSKAKIELIKVDIDSMTLIELKELIKEMLIVIGE